MTVLTKILVTFLVLITSNNFIAFGQQEDTLSMTWNLHQNKKEDITLGGEPSGEIPPDSSSIWKKPEKSTITLVMVKPKDLGFADGFNFSDFLMEAKRREYFHCPQWVPVQAYLEFGNNKKRIFFYTGESDKYWALGKNDETYRSQDLWRRSPDGRSDSIWIFVKSE